MAVTDYKDKKVPTSVAVDPVFYHYDEATGKLTQVNALTEILKALNAISSGGQQPTQPTTLVRHIDRLAAGHSITLQAPVNWLAILGSDVTEFYIDGSDVSVAHELQSTYGEATMPEGYLHPDVELRVGGGAMTVIWETLE